MYVFRPEDCPTHSVPGGSARESRNPSTPSFDPFKSFRCNAHNCHGHPIHIERLPQHIWISREPPRPVVVADHRDGAWFVSSCSLKPRPSGSLRQAGEEGAAHHVAFCLLRFRSIADCDFAARQRAHRRSVARAPDLLSQRIVNGVGEGLIGIEVPVPRGGFDVLKYTRRSGSATGSDRSKTAFITLKTAVFAPTPSARVRIAVAANPGLWRNDRRPKRRSRSNLSSPPIDPHIKALPRRRDVPELDVRLPLRFLLALSFARSGRQPRVRGAP